jgi:hypothetical protein
LGLSEAFGYAIGTQCPEFVAASIVLMPLMLSPFIIAAVIIFRNVRRHAVFVRKEHSPFHRFKDEFMGSRDTWGKYYGLGLPLAAKRAMTHAREVGEWETVSKDQEIHAAQHNIWKHPCGNFVERYGPIFEDYTEVRVLARMCRTRDYPQHSVGDAAIE